MKKHVDRQWRAQTAALTGLLAAALVTPAMAADEAGKPHTNGAGDDAECVFVEQSDGPFDIQWLK
jgi:hypothetical protein